jgi:hypothetical protein
MEDSLRDIYNKTLEELVDKWIIEGLSYEEINKKLDEFDSERVQSFIVETSSNDMFRFAKKNRKRIARSGEKSNKEFIAHQDKLWGKCFEASEVMYTLSIEAAELYGQYVENKVSSDQKEPKKFIYLALQHIHGRVCQQFAEVLCLLRGGFADAAHARWRSMYELCCIAEFIKRNGEDIARKYIDQSVTDDGRYTWALEAQCFTGLKKRRLTFEDIESRCDFVNEELKKQYKLACLVHHASPQGTFKRLSNGEPRNIIPAGSSDYGIAMPAESAAYCLQLATTLFLTIHPYLDGIARCRFLRMWLDQIQRVYQEAHIKYFAELDKKQSAEDSL